MRGWPENFGVILLATLLAGSPAVQAGEIRINGSHCSSEIRLVARDTRLSEVLTRLAQALDFRLDFGSDSDPVVTVVDTERQPQDLVMQLTPSGNVSMTQGRDPRCNGRQRILQVWVLPNRQSAERQQRNASQQLPRLQQTAEQARLEQQAIDLYYKAHGVEFPP